MISKTINSESCLLNVEIDQLRNAKNGVALVQFLLERIGSGAIDQDAIKGAWEMLDSVRGLLDNIGKSSNGGKSKSDLLFK